MIKRIDPTDPLNADIVATITPIHKVKLESFPRTVFYAGREYQTAQAQRIE